jgi:hypothetical protein
MSNTTPQKTNTIQQRALKRWATWLHKKQTQYNREH